MQEPDIPPPFQAISKAESPLSFFGDEVPTGVIPIRVITGTTQRQAMSILR
jgi:hypothetical protein